MKVTNSIKHELPFVKKCLLVKVISIDHNPLFAKPQEKPHEKPQEKAEEMCQGKKHELEILETREKEFNDKIEKFHAEKMQRMDSFLVLFENSIKNKD